MPSQTEHGKAFEFACLKGIENTITNLGKGIKCQVKVNDSYNIANQFFNALPSQKHRDILLLAGSFYNCFPFHEI